MADNVLSGNSVPTAADLATYSGDAGQAVQLVRPVLVTGAEGSKTVIELPGDATNGLDVDVTRLSALVAGTANIGDVDVLTQVGSATIASGQVTPTATGATLLTSRATRRNMTFYNGTNMTVYVGPATVTTANGLAIPPGAALTLNSAALIQNVVATVTGLTGVVSYIEEYD